jgi:histidinol dehydrogenase
MKIIKSTELDDKFFDFKDTEILPVVYEILKDVQENGDRAVRKYSEKYDKVSLDNFLIDRKEIKNAFQKVDKEVIESINHAAENIRKFANKQLENFKDFEIEIENGVFAGQKIIPIERIGAYIPGGRFPLVSTLLMCAIPAQIAGVKEIAIFSPPTYIGSIHPAVLVAADIVGLNEIYRIGGVQAIGAMAYGTNTIKKVDKIVGPGNKYVAFAKKVVFGIVGIDFIAGPTEIIIIADDFSKPEYIAADLLAQAEHDFDAQPVLITTSEKLASEVISEVDNQLKDLSTKGIAEESIKNNGIIILVKDLDEAILISNKKAPEHLELQGANPDKIIDKLKNYGTLFIGEYSAEVLGDYSSGLNHTLPTNSSARYTGGLSVKDFIKIQTTLRINKNGINLIGPAAKSLADVEGLAGHKRSIEVRMKS